jgi:hypothetical protein
MARMMSFSGFAFDIRPPLSFYAIDNPLVHRFAYRPRMDDDSLEQLAQIEAYVRCVLRQYDLGTTRINLLNVLEITKAWRKKLSDERPRAEFKPSQLLH